MKKIFIFISFILVTQFTIGQQQFHANNGTVIPNAAAPTYATWNPADKGAGVTLSGSNLIATFGGASNGVRSTIGKSSGKWFCELKLTSYDNANQCFGIALSSASLTDIVFAVNDTWMLYGSVWDKVHNTVFDSYYTGSAALNTVVGIAVDMDAGTIRFYIDGVDVGQAYSGITGTVYIYCADFSNLNAVTANFGASAFEYSVPGGYNSGWYN